MATPMGTLEKLSTMEGDALSATEATNYRSIVGVLRYLTLTRPDIPFSVNKMCQFLSAPTAQHWSAVKRILCYLKNNPSVVW